MLIEEISFLWSYAEVDTSPPHILNCPSNIESTTEVGFTGQIITWNEPRAVDTSGNVTLLVKTHSSGGSFNDGSTTVFYMFEDSSHNIAVCSFIIRITTGKLIYFTMYFNIEHHKASLLCQKLRLEKYSANKWSSQTFHIWKAASAEVFFPCANSWSWGFCL